MSQSISFIKSFSLSAIVGTALGFLFVGYVVYAQFQPPTAAPPGNNVALPLNVTGVGQIKEGGLTLGNSLSPTDSGLIVVGGRVGIGTATPDTILNIVGSDVRHYIYSDTPGCCPKADYEFYFARGTEASPTAIQDTDELGSIRFYGYDGTGFSIGAQITAAADGSMGSVSGDIPTKLKFRTKPNVSSGSPGSLTTRMVIDDQGNVGINDSTPDFKLDVDGSAGKPGGGSWSDASDERLKKNIVGIDGSVALEKIKQLRGVLFEWINPEEHRMGVRASVIAQELETVFPDWVESIDAEGKDKELIPEGNKAKAISFPHDFNAYLIEAIKEQQRQIEQLRVELDELREQIQ